MLSCSGEATDLLYFSRSFTSQLIRNVQIARRGSQGCDLLSQSPPLPAPTRPLQMSRIASTAGTAQREGLPPPPLWEVKIRNDKKTKKESKMKKKFRRKRKKSYKLQHRVLINVCSFLCCKLKASLFKV